ncbi:hypothetical protein INT45_004095 [Circinella minor]|uniref:Transposase domain-containing protein n=1 Tax=Circinella minor TaxID=1195481 RepID=A0A8H7RQD2_9FUNG|nr:hypothetical protein INT45_004095 [Circinella minor]
MYLLDDKTTDCTHCSTARYKEGSTTEPAKIMQQLPLKEQLALLVSDKKTCEMLEYRSKRPTKENVMTDIFDGKLYNNVKHLFENELVIGLWLYTDDYQQFKSMGILPGPNKPQDMTFFKPLLSDLEQLCKNGIIVETEAGSLRVRAHLLFCGSDTLAVAKMAGHSSHTHYRECRFCLICGEFMLHHMTFPPKPTSRPCVGKQLWRIIIGEYDSHKLSASFAGDCSDIYFHSGFYRSINWIHFALYLVPSLLLEYYTDESTCDALMNLATAFKYICTRELHTNDIVSLKQAVSAWNNWLLVQVNNKKLPGSVFTINQHYLLHMYKLVERLGPMPHYATFYAGVNSGNVIVEIAAIQRRNRLQEPQEQKRKTVLASTLANSPEIWGPFSKKSATDMKCVTQLKNFWAIHQNTYNIIIDQHQELETGRRLWKESIVYGSKNHSFIRIITKVNTDLSWTSSIRPEKH